MTSLRRLNIERLDNTIGLAVALDAALARLTNLTAVSLDSGVLASGVLVGGALLGSMEEHLPSLLALPRLAGLRLRYAGVNSAAGGAFAASLTELQLLSDYSYGGSSLHWLGTTALCALTALRRLCVAGRHTDSREPLLQILGRLATPPPMALPPQLQRLCEVLADLTLEGVTEADSGALRGLSRLQALTGLEFNAAALTFKTLPPAVMGLRLRSLSILACSGIRNLPDGPYLSHLTHLQWWSVLEDPVLACLGRASALRVLSLRLTNGILSGRHTGVIARLPQLRRLLLNNCKHDSIEQDTVGHCTLAVQLYQQLNADPKRKVALEFVEDELRTPVFEGFE